ncbi:hypothetical protein MTR67_022544, partial [Solanum verrucosum]
QGIRGVIRDHLGSWVLGFTEHIPLTDPLGAELQAMRKGLTLAVEHKLSPIEINCDFTEVIKMLSINNLRYDDIIDECTYLMTKLDITKVEHVFRSRIESLTS